MRFIEKCLIVSLIVIWCSVVFKYEAIALLSRSGSSSGGSRSGSGSNGGSRSHRISNTIHRIGDKISDKIHHRNNPKPVPAAPAYPQPYPQQPYNPAPKPGIFGGGGSGSGGGGIGNKIKAGAGALAMGVLAKKIFSSGRHRGGHHNYQGGMYHNYNYRPDRYGTIRGDVCVNNQNYDGIMYGQFICPIDGFDYDETSCCGPIGAQYCCSPAEAAAYRSGVYRSGHNDNYDSNYNHNVGRRRNTNYGAIVGTVIGVIIVGVIVIVIGVVLIWYCKKRIYNRVPANL